MGDTGRAKGKAGGPETTLPCNCVGVIPTPTGRAGVVRLRRNLRGRTLSQRLSTWLPALTAPGEAGCLTTLTPLLATCGEETRPGDKWRI